MTELANLCARCGSVILRRKNKGMKYCGRKCYVEAERAKAPDRFWAKVDKSGSCWLYMGFRKWDGYGWLARHVENGKSRYLTAHRYSWILTHGEPEKGLQVLHRCDNPPCCNPEHLFLGTHADNHRDKYLKGRARNSHSPSLIHPERVRPGRVYAKKAA